MGAIASESPFEDFIDPDDEGRQLQSSWKIKFEKDMTGHVEKPFKLHIRNYWYNHEPNDGSEARYMPTKQGCALVSEEFNVFYEKIVSIFADTLPEVLQPYERVFILKNAKKFGLTCSNYPQLEKRIAAFTNSSSWYRSLCDEAREEKVKPPTKCEADLFIRQHEDILVYLSMAYIVENQYLHMQQKNIVVDENENEDENGNGKGNENENENGKANGIEKKDKNASTSGVEKEATDAPLNKKGKYSVEKGKNSAEKIYAIL